ncbi:hypothetical protein [Streptomyces griseorubiginosus]|uniref:hypothetical protein n=1 Tax=Streptomyces griseorubiginosus TaxID=67304 RepID=UPI002E80B56D|nr:hypothetical protein [Streptomyces griseorubiginosus]WUB49499.1 hypothetical protein OHN19_41645 [Streptomyces griseorubiginosus]WUB58028.1 hypothetical protein OG942_41655 [Streptomyces griseorubiginosus]
MARLSWASGPVPSRRLRRRHLVRRLRAEGLYGPRFRDVLPAFAGVVAVVCALVAALTAGYRAVGVEVPVAGVAVLALVVTVGVRRGRPGARRRLGHYTADELSALDTEGLALAVARMLRRDGWRVRLLPAPDRPRLCARDATGQRIDVAFRPVAEPLPDEDLPHPHPHRGDRESPLRLVVHRGVFSARDVRWARREETIRLLDGPALRRWAAGTRLDDLLSQEN